MVSAEAWVMVESLLQGHTEEKLLHGLLRVQLAFDLGDAVASGVSLDLASGLRSELALLLANWRCSGTSRNPLSVSLLVVKWGANPPCGRDG